MLGYRGGTVSFGSTFPPEPMEARHGNDTRSARPEAEAQSGWNLSLVLGGAHRPCEARLPSFHGPVALFRNRGWGSPKGRPLPHPMGRDVDVGVEWRRLSEAGL